MSIRPWLSALLTLPLLTLIGCTSTTSPDEVDIPLSVSYEKRTLGPTGFSTPMPAPVRFCFAEVRDAATDGVWASGFLGPDGKAWATVPRGTRIYLKVYAQYEVPSTAPGGSFFFRGSVKPGRAGSAYPNADAFNALPNASLSTPATVADSGSSLSALATDATRDAGPFAIADQAVTFGLGIRDLEPNLRLPNLHSFWNASLSNPTPATTFPSAARDNSGRVLRQGSERAIFQHEVRAHASGSSAAWADEFNDGKLLEAFAHLLFADYSYPPDGRSFGSIIRRDNDPVYVAREIQAEASLAFADGFCDFLAGALRNDPVFYDVQPDGSLHSFRLDRHDQFPRLSGQGEFYRGAVAISLWGTWKNALGGGLPGLWNLWDATMGNQAGEYNAAPLGAYPTYLVGLKRIVGTANPSAWTATLAELAQEDIGDVTQAAYFSGSSLWTNLTLPPVTVSGSIQTHEPSLGRYYDRNQGIAFRFQQPTPTTRSITLTPTGGQDLWLEVLGPYGYVLDAQGLPVVSTADTRVNGVPQPRTLSLPNLPAGEYVVRVRAGFTSATVPAAGFTLALQ